MAKQPDKVQQAFFANVDKYNALGSEISASTDERSLVSRLMHLTMCDWANAHQSDDTDDMVKIVIDKLRGNKTWIETTTKNTVSRVRIMITAAKLRNDLVQSAWPLKKNDDGKDVPDGSLEKFRNACRTIVDASKESDDKLKALTTADVKTGAARNLKSENKRRKNEREAAADKAYETRHGAGGTVTSLATADRAALAKVALDALVRLVQLGVPEAGAVIPQVAALGGGKKEETVAAAAA